MITDPKDISSFIEQQFPEFYRTDGPDFIQFIKAYYEWEATVSQTRSLMEYRDIDTTPERFLINFQNEYMHQIPKEILGDKRLLQKHILDLYRAKGSVEGIRLLFRLLFNEEIEFYIPSVDIFKLDNSVFYEAQYMEISKNDKNVLFDQKNITGVISGATAIVESYERRTVSGVLIDVLFLSNINGAFLVNENITYTGLPVIDRPYILGSPTSFIVLDSSANFIDGEELVVTSSESGLYLKIYVDTLENNSTGIIQFTLLDGGYGYSMEPTIIISAGANTMGANASFEVGAISNTVSLPLTSQLVGTYANVVLNSANLAYGVGDTTNMALSNINTDLNFALEYANVTFGEISRIDVINPGYGYDGNVNIQIYDPRYLSLHPPGTDGNNAVVYNNAINGSGFIGTIKVKNSGFGYHKDGELMVFGTGNGDIRVMTGELQLGALGISEGYWADTSSFIDSDKYLQDDDYYQEFSYEIKVKKKMSDYVDILRKTVHPTGNKIFGKAKLISEG